VSWEVGALCAAGRPSSPQPLFSQPHTHPCREKRGLKCRTNLSLFSRRPGVRMGEEGRGDEGASAALRTVALGIGI
jgi:hypothetical protein